MAEAMGFLALITRDTPGEIAAERKKIEALLVEQRGRNHEGLDASGFCRQFEPGTRRTKLRETADVLNARVAELGAACSEFIVAVGSLTNPETGATRLITRSLSLMQTELANASKHVRLLTRDLRAEVRSTVAFIAVVALVVGFLLGVLSARWIHLSLLTIP